MLLAVLALLLLMPCLGCAKQGKKMPVANHGVLDLSGWDPVRDGPVALDGQWEFYWDRLLTPEDFKADAEPPEMSGYLSFPGFWKDHELLGRPLPGTGQATFRLRILPGPAVHQLGMRLFSIPAAYSLWVNGQLVASAGVVGQTAETETAERTMVLAKLSSDETPLDLVLQISNHYYRRGGVHYPILLAEPVQLEEMHLRTWCWSMFFMGTLLVMSIYHFVLYILRKNDASALYFGVYCILLTFFYISMDSSEWLIKFIFSNINTAYIDKICYVFGTACPSLLYRFYRSLYKSEFNDYILYFCDLRSLAVIFIMLFLPNHVIYNVLPVVAASSLVINICYLVLLGLCVRRGHDSALFLLCGNGILGATTLYEIYLHLFSTNPETFFPIGITAFVLSQAFALAQRFSKAFTSVANLSQDMEASNIALRAEMEERNRLEREIISVSEEERRRLSHNLHDGLCQVLAGIRLRCSALERRSLADQSVAAEVSEISALLEDSVSQAYDLSRGLWPVEHANEGAGPSLEELACSVSESSGVSIEFHQNLACADCTNGHVVQLYRIAQEAVANAVKHAKPNQIVISLECGPDRRLTLSVCDDGIGRGAAARTKGGLGMRIMLHRARMIGGQVLVADAAPRGTVVVCSLTCGKDAEGRDGAATRQEEDDGQG
jgi:signal transduction histidine kinase